MLDSPNVLLYGRDRHLNESRSLVLRKSGFRVCTALKPSEFELAERDARPDLVIFCHSLSQEECRNALTVSRTRWPSAHRLSLYSGSRGCSDKELGEVMDASDGPAQLIARVRWLAQNRDASNPERFGLQQSGRSSKIVPLRGVDRRVG